MCCHKRTQQDKTKSRCRQYLALSTIYCTILSRTFSNRAVRTHMCLMAWAERGWGARPADEPCLLRGSCPVLWVLLMDKTKNKHVKLTITKHWCIKWCFTVLFVWHKQNMEVWNMWPCLWCFSVQLFNQAWIQNSHNHKNVGNVCLIYKWYITLYTRYHLFFKDDKYWN